MRVRSGKSLFGWDVRTWLNCSLDVMLVGGLGFYAWRAPQVPALSKLLAFAAGYLAFTFLEYVIHRFLLHRIGFLWREHVKHHVDPDAETLTPVHQSLGVALVVGLPLFFALGPALASAAVAGGYVGFIAFRMLHDLMHVLEFAEGDLLLPLYRFHEGHHRDGEKNFGVTTRLWDRVFGTAG
jgi:sterol desaturase/sphingolipid hydroxylase (fatty acid hydroxylase superfamily)